MKLLTTRFKMIAASFGLISGLIAYENSLAQQQGMGAQIIANHASGYGLYIVRMKPSAEAGVISSFFLFNTSKLWPKNWAEIDLEFTPGYQDIAKDPALTHRFVLKNSCFDASGNYSNDFLQKCSLESATPNNLPLTSGKNNALSFNIFANSPLVMNQSDSGNSGQGPVTQLPSDEQVFYLPGSDVNPFEDLRTYYIWYTPTGVYWSAPTNNAFPDPKWQPNKNNTPAPVFGKIWNKCNPGNPTATSCQSSDAKEIAMSYPQQEMTPMNGQLNQPIEVGRQLQIMMNVWDGYYSASYGGGPSDDGVQPWGGPKQALETDHALYQGVAFYPLHDLKATGSGEHPDPRTYQYDTAEQYSDFSTPTGKFYLQGHEVAFTQLWQIFDFGDPNMNYPLGAANGYHVFCYPKIPGSPNPGVDMQKGLNLEMLAFDADNGLYPYPVPADGRQRLGNNTYTNCIWADTRGIPGSK